MIRLSCTYAELVFFINIYNMFVVQIFSIQNNARLKIAQYAYWFSIGNLQMNSSKPNV